VALPILTAAVDDDAPWRAELRHAVKDAAGLARHFTLTDSEREGVAALVEQGGLPLQITPHYLSLIDPNDEEDPLRRQMVPRREESAPDSFARRDPLGEEELIAVPNLVHRYPDRVLLLATDRCGAYCRFCTRKRLVGQGPTPTLDDLTPALDYVRAHDEIREVIVSGGDALALSDARLETVLSRIRAIPHVEIIRLATRMIAFAPSRVTDAVVDVIRRHQPVYMLVHFNHPREIPPVTAAAITKLVDAGIPVLNQTVLLRGVNDDAAVLAELFRHLTRLRARPYYLHQCDVALGTSHFRVPLAHALKIVGALRGRISGLSVPTFVIDVPGGKGKVPLHPSSIVDEDDTSITLRGFAGETARYPK
jgi:lysine 2,3-aminomutase